MSSVTCLNCDSVLPVEARFCSVCGQKTDTHRLSFGHVIHDFLHAFTHADKGIFHLLKQLAVRPGVVAKEYIAGRRKKYFSPFTFFLILAGLLVLSNTYFHATPAQAEPDPAMLARMPTEAARAQYILMFHRGAEIGGFMNKHGNIVALFAVPLFGFMTWAFFRGNKYNYAENVTANLMFLTFSNLVFTLLIYPLLGQSSGNSGATFSILALGLTLQVIYFCWCYFQFQPAHSKRRLPKAIALSIGSVALWQVLYLLVMAVYLYRNFDFYKFFVRMFQ